MTIGKETTFKELKKIVGSTTGMKKLPTAKALRESKEEIVFDGDVADAHFTIYRNGLFIYSRDGHGKGGWLRLPAFSWSRIHISTNHRRR